MKRLIAAIGLAAACSGTRSSGTSPVEAPGVEVSEPSADLRGALVKKRTLEKDETVTTASGATFTASVGWTLEERSDAITVTAPEGDLRLSYVEVAEPDRDEAIAAAWKRIGSALALQVADAVDLPLRDGWDAGYQVIYVTPVKEQRVVAAVARRKGPTWFIALVDGKQAAIDRRNAQMNNAISSLRVKGVEKESFAGKIANTLDAARIAELERFIEEARVLANVPGAAVAVVQDGVVVLASGYGVKKRGTKAQVGPRTLFMIGSVGKSLTALMMARMIDDGRFSWDTPVTTVLPSFALGDPAITKRLQMRHTLCACTGMPRQDAESVFEYSSAEDLLARMRSMKPTTDFGETFQYSNLMVSAGGFAAAHAYAPKKKLLPAFQSAMQALVFAPLDMKSTTYALERVARGDHAAPHPRDLHGDPIAMSVDVERGLLQVAPAGTAWSNAHDMARYLALELGKGKLGGKQIVSEQQLMARREPQVKISDDASYGLAWGITKESGLDAVGHDGGTYGFSSLLEMLPEHGVGIVILANAGNAGMFTGAVHRRFIELLFDGKAEAKDVLATQLERDAKWRAELFEQLSEADPIWFDTLAGGWVAPGLGRIDLARDDRGATLDAGEWKVTVGKWTGKDGSVSLLTTGTPVVGLELAPREKDGRTVLVLSDSQHEYVFERVK